VVLKVNKPLYLGAGLFSPGCWSKSTSLRRWQYCILWVFPVPHRDFPHLLLWQMIPRLGPGLPLGTLQPDRADNPHFPLVFRGPAQEMLHDELQRCRAEGNLSGSRVRGWQLGFPPQ